MTRPSPEQMKEINQQVVAQFRESGGVGTAGPISFEKCVLLTTTGRRSGQPRTMPLALIRDDDGNVLLFGSNMGSPRDPDWVHNIAADPAVTVELTGGVTYEARAEILEGAEREAAYARAIETMPHVAGHQDQAGRTIPMIRVPREPGRD